MQQTISIITWRCVWSFIVNMSPVISVWRCSCSMHNLLALTDTELLAIYRTWGLDHCCSWTLHEEGEDGGWHEVVLVFGGGDVYVGPSDWASGLCAQGLWGEKAAQQWGRKREAVDGESWCNAASVSHNTGPLLQVYSVLHDWLSNLHFDRLNIHI